MKSLLHGSTLVLSSFLLLTSAGCGGGSSESEAIVPPPVAGMLKRAESASELETSLKSGLSTVTPQVVAGDALAVAAAGPEAGGNFTGTYTQEKDVDEFDVVRYDGEHLYIAPRRFMACCFVMPAVGGAPESITTGAPESSIRILATDPANASASLASTIPLEEDISVQGMYVAGDRLVALTAQAYYGGYGDAWTSIAIWAPEKLGFRIYDLTDKSTPALETDVSMDGVFVESRRIGNTVYIVSRYTPQIEGIIYGPQTETERLQNATVLADVTLDEMLPRITINGTTSNLVDPENCYLDNDDRLSPYPVITSVTAVPIDNPQAFVNTCYNGEVYGVYVSEQALYFPQVVSYLLPGETRTRIHKFGLSGMQMSYRGSADIAGQVWRGGQADFRMSEHDGYLRVMSSDYKLSSTDFVDHHLFTLRESQDGPALEVVGQLPNTSHPEPIGKPNEQLYGVRFLGDRAFAVTFQQIDPLYAFDLSDPANPFIAGELELPGFSDFLHPVTPDLLLGLGRDTVGGVKLELFDVSDLSLPVSRGAVTVGAQGAYSEALYDRHAFTYQSDINGVDRLAIPVSEYSLVNDQWVNELGLHLFEIRDKASPGLASLVGTGRLLPPPSTEYPYADRSRSFLHDDTIYYVQDETVWSAFWSTPTLVNGPF